ncbi:hypothetical protein LSAT2_016510, partial [Lamellibrachia satsuma]
MEIHIENTSAAPHKLQRMVLPSQPDDVVIRYRPGKDMVMADILSGSSIKSDRNIDLDVQINHVQFSAQKLHTLDPGTK